MGFCTAGSTKLSAVSIDCDLAMGAHNITLGTSQTVDGFDLTRKIHTSKLTVAEFQIPAPSGDATDKENLNDNDTATNVNFSATSKYVEIDLDYVRRVTQWKLYGNAASHASARVKIQYYNESTGAWIDAATDIAVNTGSWTAWTAFASEFYTRKIKIVCTNHSGDCFVKEVEMKY